MLAQIDTASGWRGPLPVADALPSATPRRSTRGSPARSATSRRRTTCCPGGRPCRTCCSRSTVQRRLNDETRARAEMLIRAVGLAGFESHYPHELSGGMRKRASLIRTPRLRSTGHPDGRAVRRARRADRACNCRRTCSGYGASGARRIIFVTHDIAEAIALGDRTLVLSEAPAHIAGEHATPSRARATSAAS